MKLGRQLLASADVAVKSVEPGHRDFGFGHGGRRLLVRWGRFEIANCNIKGQLLLRWLKAYSSARLLRWWLHQLADGRPMSGLTVGFYIVGAATPIWLGFIPGLSLISLGT